MSFIQGRRWLPRSSLSPCFTVLYTKLLSSSVHLPPLPTWCLSSHLKRGLSFVCIFHHSLLGVSQATSSTAFLSSASSTTPYLVSLKPPQAPPFFSLHLPPLPIWCLSSHLKRGLSFVCIFHLSLLGVSQASSSAAFL